MPTVTLANSKLLDEHKDFIQDLYLTHGLRAKDVRQQLLALFSLQARYGNLQISSPPIPILTQCSEDQLKRKFKKWGIGKNGKKEDWVDAARRAKQRRLDVSQASITAKNGMPVDAARAKRAFRRHNLPRMEAKQANKNIQPCTSEEIALRRKFVNPNAITTITLPCHFYWEGLRKVLPYRGKSLPSNMLNPPSASFQSLNELYFTARNDLSNTTESLTALASLGSAKDASSLAVTELHSEAGKRSFAIARRLFTSAGSDYGILDEALTSEVLTVILPEQNQFINDMELVAYYPGIVDLPVLMSYLVYLCSNRLIQNGYFDNLADDLLDKYGNDALKYSCTEQLKYLRCFKEAILLYAARRGRYEIVQFLRPFILDLDQRLYTGAYPRTLLQEGIVYKQSSFCNDLLDGGADPGCPMDPLKLQVLLYERSAMDLAAYFTPELFHHMFNISRRKKSFTPTLLLPLAVKSGMAVADCLNLIDLGADINAMDSQGWTALQHAISAQQHRLVCVLLGLGTSADFLEEHRTMLGQYASLQRNFALPLSLAVEFDDLEICETLLRAGVNVNAYSFKPHEDLLARHYKQEPLANLPRAIFQTALQRAVWDNNTRVIQLLIEYGAKDTVENTIPCLIVATWRGNYEAVALLLQYGADFRETWHGSWLGKADAIVHASYGGHLQIMQALLDSGSHIGPTQETRGNGWTALQAACLGGNLAAVQLLLASGADVNAPCYCDDGLTALQAAIRCGELDLINLLLNWGADVNASPSRNGDTALSATIKSGSADLLRTLIAQGADVTFNGWNTRHDHDVSTIPIVAAAILDRIDFIQEMLQAGLNLNAPVSPGTRNTVLGEALSRAARNGREEAIEWFLQHNAPIIPSDLSKILFSVHFYQKFDSQVAKKLTQHLLDRGADVNALHVGETRSPTTILSRVCHSRKEDKELVQLLLDRGVDVNPDPGSHTRCEVPLIGAVSNGHIAIVELLLEYGADPNATTDIFRWTPLQHAASQGYIRIAQMLLAHGANVGAPTSDGHYTALDLAVAKGRLDMVKLLLDNYKLGDRQTMLEICRKYAEVAREECHWAILDLLESYESEAQRSISEVNYFFDADAVETGSEHSSRAVEKEINEQNIDFNPWETPDTPSWQT
ncbi:hypothetical protein PV08_10145 [Exophiala spinifera]|uniref:Clr5 domain-containing protein n=1 Tax=Exophiala spinifera TaxID=91928 RepID=A0A0D1Y7F8_9EURO|nr:uncharacterized protein PV08_10145 [Exophiala spinifera]KIW10846.1 hypothetical protein PV08_10145 [Exophiala spinifera]